MVENEAWLSEAIRLGHGVRLGQDLGLSRREMPPYLFHLTGGFRERLEAGTRGERISHKQKRSVGGRGSLSSRLQDAERGRDRKRYIFDPIVGNGIRDKQRFKIQIVQRPIGDKHDLASLGDGGRGRTDEHIVEPEADRTRAGGGIPFLLFDKRAVRFDLSVELLFIGQDKQFESAGRNNPPNRVLHRCSQKAPSLMIDLKSSRCACEARFSVRTLARLESATWSACRGSF